MLGYQSDARPALGTGVRRGNGPGIRVDETVYGIAVAGAPAPGTLLLIGSAIPLLLLWRRKREWSVRPVGIDSPTTFPNVSVS